MGKIKLCPRCNGKMVAISERTGGFSGKKAAERAEWYGDVYGPAVELTTRMARESYENQRKLEILDRQLKSVLRKRFMPEKEFSAGPILTEEERKAQRRQNAVICICEKAAAAVCEDGTVVLAGDINDDIRKEVKNWKNVVSVCLNSKSIYGLCADGRVVCAGRNIFNNEVKTWTEITELACAEDHILGLKKDGTVVAAGNNEVGQCDVSEWKDVVSINSNGIGEFAPSYSAGITTEGKLVIAGKTRMEISDVDERLGYDIVYGELTVNGMFGVAAFEGLFGEELFDRWGNLVDVSCYADTSSSIYGLREDGAVYAATSTVSYSENERKVLEESNDIVAISAARHAASFLCKDGTVLTSTHYYPEAGQETSGWEKIVTVADNGYVRIGVRTNGTVAVGGEKY